MNPRPRRTWFLLLCLLAIALAIRVKAADWVQQRVPAGARFIFGDSESYWELGHSIAQGHAYSFYVLVPPSKGDRLSIFRTPGYPMLLAGMFLSLTDGSPVIFARYIGAVLGTLAVLGVYWLAQRLFDRQTAIVAAATAAIYPGAVASSVFVLSEAPFCPLLVVQLAMQVAGWTTNHRAASFAWSLGAGMTAGAATLMRPSWLLFVPFALACGMVFSHARVRHLKLGITALIGLGAVMAPWWVRNYLVCGHFVPTTLQVGASLYDGLGPNASGASDMSFAEDRRDAEWAKLYYSPLDTHGKEYEVDRTMEHEALSWAREHPGRVLQLAAIKFTRMWNVWPNEPQFRSWPVRLAVFFTYVPIMALAICGAWKFRDRGWPCVLCWLPAVYLTLLHMVFVSSIRYREPAMLPLIVLAAGVAVTWWRDKSGVKPTDKVNMGGGSP